MSRGMAASQAGAREQAIAFFLEASRVRPASGAPHFLLGVELANRGDIESAETAFATAVLLAPHFSIARYQLGPLQFSAGRAAMALMTWRPLLSRPVTDPLPHFIEGFASLAHRRFDEALVHFRRGVVLNTEHPALSKDIDLVVASIRGGATARCPMWWMYRRRKCWSPTFVRKVRLNERAGTRMSPSPMKSLRRPFTGHPASVGESCLQHLRQCLSF